MKTIFELPTYNKDYRKNIYDIYDSYSALKKGWAKENLQIRTIKQSKEEYNYFIPTFRTKKKGPALWLIAGIHGEEPAGPIAISENINLINKLSKKVPIVLLPICNPLGYIKDWRYPYSKYYGTGDVKSVGDSEHYLLDLKDTTKPRLKKPSCKESKLISNFVLKNFRNYPPVLVLDLHEDKDPRILECYIYSQGFWGHQDPIAKDIVGLLKKRKFKIKNSGFTRFKQKIVNGIVTNVHDSSIDELLASNRIMINKKIVKGPAANSVVVVETNVTNTQLRKRINAHTYVLKNLHYFYNEAKKIKG